MASPICPVGSAGRLAVSALGLAALAAVLGTIPGCRSAPPTVAVIPRTTGMALWEPEHEGATAAAAKTGMRIYWNAPTREDDVQGQIALVERIIDKKYAGLILAPDQTLALLTPVRRALAKGVSTVIVGSPLPMQPGGKLSYILSDDDEAGRIAATRIGTILHGRGTVAVLGVNPDIAGVFDRVRSFESELARQYPRVRIVEKRLGSFNVPYEQQIAEEVLDANPHLGAILAVTTDATRGAYSALNEMHRVGVVKLVGCDQDLLMPLTTGGMDSIIAENTYQMGYRAVELLAAERQGKPVPALTKISPALVTKDNLSSPEVQRILGLDRR
jgi:ribose transport system substrate-binding protein